VDSIEREAMEVAARGPMGATADPTVIWELRRLETEGLVTNVRSEMGAWYALTESGRRRRDEEHVRSPEEIRRCCEELLEIVITEFSCDGKNPESVKGPEYRDAVQRARRALGQIS
jgi:hypothetical protein